MPVRHHTLRSHTRLALALALVTFALAGCAARPSAPATSPAAPPANATSSASPATQTPSAEQTSAPQVFAVIGDYGTGGRPERAVAKLVASWSPAYIITTGDDYYSPAGGSGTGKYENSTGAFYGDWLGTSSRPNAFFPSLGNHDFSDATPSPETYLKYFTLPGNGSANSSGNERYYDFVEGPVHFFALNSNEGDPDGITAGSKQGQWLKQQLAASTSRWNIVYDHHPPYSSDNVHHSTTALQWPFEEWGADVVLSGHAHTYERIMRDGFPYIVDGLGGAGRYSFETPVAGSEVRYADNWGALKVTVSDTALTFEFYNLAGKLIDRYELTKSAP